MEIAITTFKLAIGLNGEQHRNSWMGLLFLLYVCYDYCKPRYLKYRCHSNYIELWDMGKRNWIEQKLGTEKVKITEIKEFVCWNFCDPFNKVGRLGAGKITHWLAFIRKSILT